RWGAEREPSGMLRSKNSRKIGGKPSSSGIMGPIPAPRAGTFCRVLIFTTAGDASSTRSVKSGNCAVAADCQTSNHRPTTISNHCRTAVIWVSLLYAYLADNARRVDRPAQQPRHECRVTLRATREPAGNVNPATLAGDCPEHNPGITRTTALRQQSPDKKPQQGNKIKQSRTPHLGAFLDPEHHFLPCPVMTDGGHVDPPNSP